VNSLYGNQHGPNNLEEQLKRLLFDNYEMKIKSVSTEKEMNQLHEELA